MPKQKGKKPQHRRAFDAIACTVNADTLDFDAICINCHHQIVGPCGSAFFCPSCFNAAGIAAFLNDRVPKSRFEFSAENVGRLFSLVYHASRDAIWSKNMWLGHQMMQTPTDLYTYQELVFHCRPTLIFETGTAGGGLTLFLANMMDLLQIDGKVVSIDIKNRAKLWATHPKIEYWTGSSVDRGILDKARRLAAKAKRVMVILDSDHTEPHVAAELKAYSKFVSRNSYLIVNDTNTRGAKSAVKSFLDECKSFQQDRNCERQLLTFHPGGFLKRVR